MELDRIICGERLQPVLARDLDDLGLGARALVGEHGLARGDGERVGDDGLDAALEGAGFDRRSRCWPRCGSRERSKSWFCSSMGSASRRLRNCGMGGSSSLRLPSQVSLSPVASSKSASDQPSMRPRQSAM